MNKKILTIIKSSIQTKELIYNNPSIIENIEKATTLIIKSFKNNNKILIAGNGGSLADASHITSEFINKFYKNRKSLPAINLGSDTISLTSIANDYGFEYIYSKSISSLGTSGDVFLAISTSGNSQNIINAIQEAKSKNIATISLSGKDGGKIASMSDISIISPSFDTPRIQESHTMIGHIICEIVENSLFE